jgi:predicted RND superfamily exporter protein
LEPVTALTSRGVANNLYTQIGLILMIALSAKNGILIVEMAREGRIVHGKPILEAAVEASRSRFRPILMTSFAFGLGVVPLVLATGAGANGRISLGLSVLSGIIASTCLAVLFVPSFFALLQGFEEWRKARKKAPVVATLAPNEVLTGCGKNAAFRLSRTRRNRTPNSNMPPLWVVLVPPSRVIDRRETISAANASRIAGFAYL